MKYFCQFKQLSTGYVQGTIPPVYREDNKKPINVLGSHGVMVLDARKNLVSLKTDCIKRMKELNYSSIIGFEIVESFNDKFEGKVIYSSLT